MSAVSSVNPGLADLSQLLSSTGSSTVTSALFTPQVQSALQNASPTDLVQLSSQALELQAVGGLFANADSSTGSTPESLLFQALSSSLTQGTNAASSGSPADATAASALEQAYGLFGSPSNSGPSLSFLG